VAFTAQAAVVAQELLCEFFFCILEGEQLPGRKYAFEFFEIFCFDFSFF